MIINLLLFPFKLLFLIAGFILSMFGKMLTLFLGLVLVVSGFVLCVSLVGAVAGLPLIFLGVAFVLKGLF